MTVFPSHAYSTSLESGGRLAPSKAVANFAFSSQGAVVSSSGMRLEAFAGRRIDRIETVLGEEAVQRAINEAVEEFSKNKPRRVWSIFTNGTKEEVEAFQDEVRRSLDLEGGEQEGADGQ